MSTRSFIAAIVVTTMCDIGIAGKIHAQTLQFRHYSTDEGFYGAAFKRIVQDSLGFLWISSGSGIYKFDGYDFIAYRSNVDDSLSIPLEIVQRIWVDPSGQVWAGFPNRIAKYDRDLDGFRTYRFSVSATKEPESIFFESEHVVWLGTSEQGLARLDISSRDTAHYRNEKVSKPKHFLANTILDIKNTGDALLLATANGLWSFDRKRKVFERPLCDPDDSALFYNGNIKKIIKNSDHYWIWMDQQLVKCSNEFVVIQTLDLNLIKQRYDLINGFNDAAVRSIRQDQRGIFWMASEGLGLISFDPVKNQLRNYRHDRNDPESLPTDVIMDVFVDNNNNVWITSIPKGIIQVKQRSLQFINHLPGTPVGRIALLKTSVGDQLVMSSQGQGLWSGWFHPRKLDSLQFERVEAAGGIGGFKSLTGLYLGRDHLWLGSLTSGTVGIPYNDKVGIVTNASVVIYQHDPNNPNTIASNEIAGVFAETEDGSKFVNSWNSGLSKISPKLEYGAKGSVTRYVHDDNDTTSICDNGVMDMLIQDENSLLVSTKVGLDLYRDGTFQHILKGIPCSRMLRASDGTLLLATKIGLFEGVKKDDSYSFTKAKIPGEPFITAMNEDRLGRVWCMSYEGLYFYDRKSQQYLHFKKEDGLPSSRSISSCGSAYTDDGTMIFGNAEGITFFNPLSLHINEAIPKPLITKLKINNKVAMLKNPGSETNNFLLPGNINTLSELTLDYTQNIITLEFSAMDLTAPERNQYSYQLENFDSEPVLTDWKNRSATYTNLRPGNYTFKVRASNRDGVWSGHQAQLILHVLPPPWKTWWAYSLYGLIVATILFLARRNIVKQERLASRLAMEHLELEKVQEIDRAKTNFFANISHEFRTPLTLIQGPVQNLIEKFKADKEVESQLNLVHQNSERLLRLVNQILELAKLESGTLKNEISESDVVAFVKKVSGSFLALAIQRKISFVQQFQENGVRAIFDKDKLEKITSNLVSNALKFTPEHGAIIINLTISGKSNETGKLTLRVTDTGRGVPEDQIDKIFERFYQVSEDGNINIGSGIGLALCKELAEFLGGSLTVDSTVGEGSRFTLSLPINIVEVISEVKGDITIVDVPIPNSNGVKKEDVQDERRDEKPILLIVEDHADLRKFIISCLGDDYQFLEASNGSEGLQIAIDEVPTLILSDVMMPIMDGIEMCHKIKNDHRTCHIPLILLTAKASNESKLSGLDIGADDYIVKPFNKEELKLKIRNQVLARARMQERLRLEFLSESTTVKAVSADEKFLERLKKVIEARIGDEMLSVEALTEEMGMSRAQLYRKVTALTGMSGNEFIRKLRLHRAAQLLQQQAGPVSQVAYEVGFSNLSYFSKCFKEQFGVLPSEYATKVQIHK